MKFANFLMFIFLVNFSQLVFSYEDDYASECAQILVYDQANLGIEEEMLDSCFDIVVKKLKEKFSESELQKYYQALQQEEMQKMLWVVQDFCGGMYRFPIVSVHKLHEVCQTKRHTVSSEQLCLQFNKVQYELSAEELQEPSLDYYRQIVEWFFDFKALQDAILKRHSECAASDLSEIVDMYGWSEKTLVLTQAFVKMTLDNYYFYCLMLHGFKKEALCTILKQSILSSDLSAHEIIKLHKFLYSSLGQKALAVHKECIELITEEFLENVKL